MASPAPQDEDVDLDIAEEPGEPDGARGGGAQAAAADRHSLHFPLPSQDAPGSSGLIAPAGAADFLSPMSVPSFFPDFGSPPPPPRVLARVEPPPAPTAASGPLPPPGAPSSEARFLPSFSFPNVSSTLLTCPSGSAPFGLSGGGGTAIFGSGLSLLSSTSLSSCSPSSSPSRAGLLSLPPEIHARLLLYLDPTDVLSYARTCKACSKYADTQQLWRHQWSRLSRKTPFTFLPTAYMVELGVNFKDSCRRLWKILVSEGVFGGLVPSKCPTCKDYTCRSTCVEERPAKVSVDIGGKITWVITPNCTLKRHLSMIAVPKVLKCYDCDATLNRDELSCDCMPSPQDLNPSLVGAHLGQRMQREAYCLNRHMSSHTALEYCSQPLSDIWSQPVLSQPFCLFCEEDKVNRMLCEREMVSTTKYKMQSVRPPYMSGEEEFNAYNAVSPLANGYCHDTAAILGSSNLDLLSPLLALGHEDAFPVVRAFFTHLFKEYRMVGDLQRPNCSLVLTHAGLSAAVKEALLRFFFEDMKIARLCLLPKALAMAYLFEAQTCVVVDSGATSTHVWVVLEGRLDEERSQSLSVGGWHVSQLLKQAMAWRGENKEARGATVSSLDTSTVKQKCRLSLNPAREGLTVPPPPSAYSSCSSSPSSDSAGCFGQQRNFPFPCSHPQQQHGGRHGRHHYQDGAAGGGWAGMAPGAATETLLIKTMQEAQRKLELTEVTLSSELLLAPEMMYGSLDLPSMVKEATRDLPDHLVKDCFSHIIITGGNTDLQGFSQRLSSDLRALMPEHAPIVNVCTYPTGSQSWNTVMGANTVKVPSPYEDILHMHEPGLPLWMSREEYIIFGGHQLASDEGGIEG